ncbi:lipase family protein [Francisella sp. TX07-6608]|uniref:lipase family protein n=1 Tax=Francisella sp. TX07-6608 TaxID=573568 RepID=UPI0008F99373|nr:lipase family protein [Francisella sp. TX07-6608]OIN84963.1 lipase family protein [Francisella sp. TX07-6608]OIN85004.1 lipase family protein [Francisella sp. TX07-6608]
MIKKISLVTASLLSGLAFGDNTTDIKLSFEEKIPAYQKTITQNIESIIKDNKISNNTAVKNSDNNLLDITTAFDMINEYEKKMDIQESEINNLKEKIEKQKNKLSSGQYLTYWHMLKGRKQSGYLNKYNLNSFPANSLYITTTGLELQDYAQASGVIYKIKQHNIIDEEKLSLAQESIDIYKAWLQKLNNGTLSVNEIIKQANSYDDKLNLSDSGKITIVSLKNKIKNVIAEYKRDINKAINTDPYKNEISELRSSLANFGKVEHVFFRNKHELSGIILYDKEKNRMSIIFAGSKSSHDWLNNFKAWSSEGDIKNSILIPGGIHKGVMDMYKNDYDSIYSYFMNFFANYNSNENKKPLTIVVSGHSLGGALSTLMAYQIKTAILPKALEQNTYLKAADFKNTLVQNITFGAPRFVSKEGAAAIESVLGKGNILRIWNAYDIVPSIMLGALNSAHAGIDIPIADRITHEMYRPLVNFHNMDHYWALINKSFTKLKEEATSGTESKIGLHILEDKLLTLQESPAVYNGIINDIRSKLLDFSAKELKSVGLNLVRIKKKVVELAENNKSNEDYKFILEQINTLFPELDYLIKCAESLEDYEILDSNEDNFEEIKFQLEKEENKYSYDDDNLSVSTMDDDNLSVSTMDDD